MESTEILIENCFNRVVGQDRLGVVYLMSSENMMIVNVE